MQLDEELGLVSEALVPHELSRNESIERVVASLDLALPAADDGTRRRRGGRRHLKLLLLPARRSERVNPRAVKIKMSNYRR